MRRMRTVLSAVVAAFVLAAPAHATMPFQRGGQMPETYWARLRRDPRALLQNTRSPG
jgi:hypothetical protein